jgi:hypothetical protein
MESYLAIMNTLNTTTPIGSALLSPTGYRCFQVLSSIAFEAPKRIRVLRRSIAESTTEANKEMELETSATMSFRLSKTMFCVVGESERTEVKWIFSIVRVGERKVTRCTDNQEVYVHCPFNEFRKFLVRRVPRFVILRKKHCALAVHFLK